MNNHAGGGTDGRCVWCGASEPSGECDPRAVIDRLEGEIALERAQFTIGQPDTIARLERELAAERTEYQKSALEAARHYERAERAEALTNTLKLANASVTSRLEKTEARVKELEELLQDDHSEYTGRLRAEDRVNELTTTCDVLNKGLTRAQRQRDALQTRVKELEEQAAQCRVQEYRAAYERAESWARRWKAVARNWKFRLDDYIKNDSLRHGCGTHPAAPNGCAGCLTDTTVEGNQHFQAWKREVQRNCDLRAALERVETLAALHEFDNDPGIAFEQMCALNVRAWKTARAALSVPEKVKVTLGSDNIFADLGVSNPEEALRESDRQIASIPAVQWPIVEDDPYLCPRCQEVTCEC